jgi:hypothetical protein
MDIIKSKHNQEAAIIQTKPFVKLQLLKKSRGLALQ